MRAQTCRVLSFRGTQQVCARIRQVCERLAGPPAQLRRGQPTPEQKSRQRIEFTSMGRIDPDADSRKPQVKALSSRRLLRVHPKIRSFGGTFAWHRARTPLRAAFFGSRWRFSRPGGGSRCIRAAGGCAGRRPSVPWGKYKKMHVTLESVTAGRLGFAPHCTVACRKCSRIYRWCSLAHL